MHTKDGRNAMSFNGNGKIFVGLHSDIYGSKENLDILFDRLSSLKIFGYKKSDYEQWKLSRGRIEDLSDTEFQELKNIVKGVYNKKIS
jgi:hypothetical protein